MKISQELKIKYPKLYEAALDEFSCNTFDNASLNNILKNAGMSKGSFYHNVKDKFNLYIEILACIAYRKQEFISSSPDFQKLPSNIFDRLKGLCIISLSFLINEPKMYAFNEQILKESAEFMKRIYGDTKFTEIEIWRTLIDDAYKNGEIRTDLPREIVIPFLEGAFKSLPKAFQPGMTVEEYKKIAIQYIELIKDAISPKIQ